MPRGGKRRPTVCVPYCLSVFSITCHTMVFHASYFIMDFLRLKAGLLITLPTVAVYKASSLPLVLLCSLSDSVPSTHLLWTCLICSGCDQSSAHGGVVPDHHKAQFPAEGGPKQIKKKKRAAEIITAESCWNKGRRGYENPRSQTCILAIWIRQRKRPYRDFHRLAQTLIPGWRRSLHQLLLSSLRLVIRLKSRAGGDASPLLAHREEKAMFHKTTHSLLKINLHYTNAICIIRL